MSSIKIREKTSNNVTNIRILISHPMETGQRKHKKGEKKGQKIPAHYIQEVICKYNGKMVMTAALGPAISKNPYLSFKTETGKVNLGDTNDVSWVDNKGGSDSKARIYKLVPKIGSDGKPELDDNGKAIMEEKWVNA